MNFIVAIIYILLRSKFKKIRRYTLVFCFIILLVAIAFLVAKEVSAAEGMISFIILLSTLVFADIALEELGRKSL